jgi:hypothetical protein
MPMVAQQASISGLDAHKHLSSDQQNGQTCSGTLKHSSPTATYVSKRGTNNNHGNRSGRFPTPADPIIQDVWTLPDLSQQQVPETATCLFLSMCRPDIYLLFP